MEFVINEWLPEYLRADADKKNNSLAIKFLKKFLQSNDKIIVKIPSPFTNKIYKCEKVYSGFPSAAENYRNLRDIIFANTERTRWIYQSEIKEIPKITYDKLHAVGTNFYQDLYLFETAHLSESKLIITTDAALKDFMKDDPHFKIQLLEDFLPQY